MAAEVIRLHTFRQALSHADEWQKYAWRMEALLVLAQAKLEASETLLEFAYAEIERLKGLI